MIKITAELVFELEEIPTQAELDNYCERRKFRLTRLIPDMSGQRDWRYCFQVEKLPYSQIPLKDYETQERNANTPKEIIDRNMAVIVDYLRR